MWGEGPQKPRLFPGVSGELVFLALFPWPPGSSFSIVILSQQREIVQGLRRDM